MRKVSKDLQSFFCATHKELVKMPADYERILNGDENENMVSNLPLLFAGGYPTSLDRITESQLEQFIPFMVQCSLGDIQSPVIDNTSEPEWWPENVPFTIPIRKPQNVVDWLNKLKEIVAICYQFHKSVFLLRFCENLASYQPESLRFINNYNSTTSLFDRISNKLLVTFRNENMLYDQRVNNKKTLMPKMPNSQSAETHQMVEQALFDIYLCDNCEAELYSLDAYHEHEKVCQNENVASESDDDDVIFCGEESIEKDTAQQQNSFLQHFQLCKNTDEKDEKPVKSPHKRQQTMPNLKGSNNNSVNFDNMNSVNSEVEMKTEKKIKRVPRRAPGLMTLLKSQIPITSPAGQRLIAQANTTIAADYIRERIARNERFCVAPPLALDCSNRPKFMVKKPTAYTAPPFRSNTKHFHLYKFPRRQFSTKARNEAVALLERLQMQQSHCKSLRITVQRLSHRDIEQLKTQFKVKRRKVSQKSIEVIDLCSSGDESIIGDSETSNEIPRSSESTKNIRPHPNTPHFVDCSVPADRVTSGTETIIDPRLQLTTARSQCDSTSNLIVKQAKPSLKLLAATQRTVNLQQMQQDKENRIYSYIREQANTLQTNAFSYGDDLELNNSIVSSSIATNNQISIDLTL